MIFLNRIAESREDIGYHIEALDQFESSLNKRVNRLASTLLKQNANHIKHLKDALDNVETLKDRGKDVISYAQQDDLDKQEDTYTKLLGRAQTTQARILAMCPPNTLDIKPVIETALDEGFKSTGQTYSPRFNKYITFKLHDKDVDQIDKLKHRGITPALVTASAKDEVLATFKHGLTDAEDIERLRTSLNKMFDGKATPAATEIPKKSAVIEASGLKVVRNGLETPEVIAKATPEKRHQPSLDNAREL